jgi:CubicO group peptidase (beta-lactamase class C family)
MARSRSRLTYPLKTGQLVSRRISKHQTTPGFIALGELVTVAAGHDLDTAVRTLVTGPLGLTAVTFNPNGPGECFAATERRPDGSAWAGTVHDENVRLMGGVAGHAGLFAPAADLARFAAWWVSDDDAVVPASLRRAVHAAAAPRGSSPGSGPAGPAQTRMAR